MSAPTGNLTSRDLASLDPASTGDPFVRVRFRHGMLLGAEDMTVEQRSGLLRHRLHHVLLHGAGTILGLRVSTATTDGHPELTVSPGLALDALGREIYVPRPLCLRTQGVLDVLRWDNLEARPGQTRRRAYVVLRYASAASQPVPALRPVGALDEDALAMSRISDTYRVDLESRAPDGPSAQLLALLGGDDAPATDGSGWLEPLWTADADAPLLLATVEIERDARGLAQVVAVDDRARPRCHNVSTLLEQAPGIWLGGQAAGARCRMRDAAVRREGGTLGLTLGFTAALDERTLAGARLSQLGAAGWSPAVSSLFLSGDGRALRLVPASPIAEGARVQLHLPGQGQAPLLDEHGEPLAGWWDDPLPAAGRGLDASWVGTWSEVG